MHLPKLIYWFSTIPLCLLLLFSAYMYFFNHFDAVLVFQDLGYPTYLIYPLAIAKLAAVAAILSKKSQFLKKMAYAGLFYNFIIAFFAHALEEDGAGLLSFLGLMLVIVSFVFHKILTPKNKSGYEL